MPTRPKHPCAQPGCPNLCESGQKYCADHKKLHPEYTRSASARGYTYRWAKASKAYLRAHPLCAACLKKTPPRYTRATVVDHIVPHRGDPVLFWDQSNWQPLCKHCHDVKTARYDRNPMYHY